MYYDRISDNWIGISVEIVGSLNGTGSFVEMEYTGFIIRMIFIVVSHLLMGEVKSDYKYVCVGLICQVISCSDSKTDLDIYCTNVSTKEKNIHNFIFHV